MSGCTPAVAIETAGSAGLVLPAPDRPAAAVPRCQQAVAGWVASAPVSDPAPRLEPRPEQLPAPLRVAAALAGIEALLLALFGLAELFSLTGVRIAMGVTTTLFFLGYGAGLAWCAWRLSRRESWARAPVVLAQLIQLGVAWSFRGGATSVASVVLALVAGIVLVGIFHPRSLTALVED